MIVSHRSNLGAGPELAYWAAGARLAQQELVTWQRLKDEAAGTKRLMKSRDFHRVMY